MKRLAAFLVLAAAACASTGKAEREKLEAASASIRQAEADSRAAAFEKLDRVAPNLMKRAEVDLAAARSKYEARDYVAADEAARQAIQDVKDARVAAEMGRKKDEPAPKPSAAKKRARKP